MAKSKQESRHKVILTLWTPGNVTRLETDLSTWMEKSTFFTSIVSNDRSTSRSVSQIGASSTGGNNDSRQCSASHLFGRSTKAPPNQNPGCDNCFRPHEESDIARISLTAFGKCRMIQSPRAMARMAARSLTCSLLQCKCHRRDWWCTLWNTDLKDVSVTNSPFSLAWKGPRIGCFLKKFSINVKKKFKKKRRWSSRKIKIWYKYNNIIVFIFA